MPTLTCAELPAIHYTAELLFKDSAKKQDYVARVGAANAIIENTTANIQLLDANGKKRSAKIYWNKNCNITVGDCSTTPVDLCAITGNQSDAECKTYEIDGCLHASFAVDGKLYETSNLSMNEVFADNLLKTAKQLDEAVAKAIIAKVNGFTSVNAFQGGIGCPDTGANWGTTFINPSYWTPEVYGYFLQVANYNKFTNPFLLDGDNLYMQHFKAMNNAGNADGSGAKSMIETIKYYEDMVNMATVNGTERKTYLIDRGSLAFSSYALWSKNGMTNPLEHGAGKTKFSMPSKNIPGLVYDVYTETVCSAEYEKVTVLLKANFDVFNGAEACNGSTGVLEFVCGSCPA